MQKTPGKDTSGESTPGEPAATNLEESLLRGKTAVSISVKPPPLIRSFTSTELRAFFTDRLNKVHSDVEILVVTSYGKKMGVVVSPGISDLIFENKIKMKIAVARVKIYEMLACAQYLNQSFIIDRRGEPVAAVVPLRILEIMDEIAEDTAKTLGALEKPPTEQTDGQTK